jgi:hypothetical protein
MPPEFYRALHTTKTTPLAKEADDKNVKGNVRPVGPPEVLKKIAQKCLMLTRISNGTTVEQLLRYELRRGNSFALHGPEAKLRQLRKAYGSFTALHGKPIVMKVDMANGYGEVKLAQVLSRLYTSPRMKEVARFLHAVAGIPITVMMRTEREQYEQLLQNAQSLMQGDVLSPVLYSLAIMPALQAARQELREVLGCAEIDFFAYIDDVTWVLPDKTNAARTAERIIKKHLAPAGALVKDSKTLVLYPKESREKRLQEDWKPAERQKKAVEFIDVLGTPFIGPSASELSANGRAAVEEFVLDRMMLGSRGQQHKHRLEKLRGSAWSPHVAPALTIIRRSIIPSTEYITRNTPPALSEKALKAFDQEVAATVTALLHVTSMTETARRVIALPVSFGGLGIHRVVERAEDLVRAAEGTGAHKEARKRVMTRVAAEYRCLHDELRRAAETTAGTPYQASAAMMLDHLSDYDHAAAQTINTSARYIFDAPCVETGPLLMRIYHIIGHIPPALAGDVFKCAICNQLIPLADRMDHGARCSRISRIARHDVVRDLVLAKARYALGIQEVTGEQGFRFVNGAEGAPPPADLHGQRSDLSFRTRLSSEEIEKVRVDFCVTAGGRADRVLAEERKRKKYTRIQLHASEPFVFIPAVMSTSGTLQREFEDLLRFVSEHYQDAMVGSHSHAVTRAFMGDIIARMLQREYSMLMLAVGADSREPDVVFRRGSISSSSSHSPAATEGKITQRQQTIFLAAEAAFAARAIERDDAAEALQDE